MSNTGANCLIFADVSSRDYSEVGEKTVWRHARWSPSAKPVHTGWPNIPISMVGAFHARSHEKNAAILPVFPKFAGHCPYLGSGNNSGTAHKHSPHAHTVPNYTQPARVELRNHTNAPILPERSTRKLNGTNDGSPFPHTVPTLDTSGTVDSAWNHCQ